MARVERVVGRELWFYGRAACGLSQPSEPIDHSSFLTLTMCTQMPSITITDSWKSEFELPTNKEVGATLLTDELRADSPVSDLERSRESDIDCLQNQDRVYIFVETL